MTKFIKNYGQFIVGFIFTLYFFYTFFNALDINKEVVIATLLTIVIYLQSIGELLYFYKKKGKPRLQDWMRFVLFIILILDFMKIVNSADGVATVSFSMMTISLNDSPFTMVVIIFALLSLDMAYLISKTLKKAKMSNINIQQYAIKRKGWIFGILMLSTIIQIYLLFSGISGYGSTFERTTGMASLANVMAVTLNPFALIISAYIIFIENKYNKTYQLIFYGALSIQVLLGLLSAMKESTLMPILYVGIVFLIGGRKLPSKLLYIGIFFLVLLYPINNAYRNVINNPYLNTSSHSLNMAIAINNLLKEPLSETLSTGVESYSHRGSMFPYLQYVINIEPTWNYYKYMTRYTVLPVVWFLPRVIWPEKPKADIGGVLSTKIVGENNPSAVTPTGIGWAYLEGGILFVILIFILLGLFFEFIDRQNYKNPITLIFYIIVLHSALKPEWEPYFFFASMIQKYVMYWLLLKFIGVRKMEYLK